MKRNLIYCLSGVSMAAALSFTTSMTAFADESPANNTTETIMQEADADGLSRFAPGTSVNGILIEGLTPDEAKAKLETFFNSQYTLTLLQKGGKKEVLNGADFNYKIHIASELSDLLEQQNAPENDTASYPGYMLTLNVSYDEAALSQQISALSCVSGADLIQTQNARISAYQEGQPFTILKEVDGNSLNPALLSAAIKTAIASGWNELKLTDAGCYDTIQIRSNDENLKNLCSLMNQYQDMTITYRFGEAEEILNGSVISSWLTGTDETGQITVDETLVSQFIQELAAKYDTAGTERIFHTAGGKDVALTGPFGKKINQEEETAALTAMIRTGQSQERIPAYSAGNPESLTDWGSTYVEIDLTGQHVYMFKDGTLVWDAPCVTGNVSKNYTTPPGIYSLNYKQKDRILRGAKKADGTYEYESHVDYWMPFNGGIGLHDASWREKFGGTIYQYGGSHGCINLPPAKAKILYDLITPGMPVICYN